MGEDLARSSVFRLEGRREEIRRGEAAERTPFLGDLEDFLLARQMIQVIGITYGLPQREIARQGNAWFCGLYLVQFSYCLAEQHDNWATQWHYLSEGSMGENPPEEHDHASCVSLECCEHVVS